MRVSGPCGAAGDAGSDPPLPAVAPARGCAVWGLSSAGRAPDLHSGGQEFDPPRLHHVLLARHAGQPFGAAVFASLRRSDGGRDGAWAFERTDRQVDWPRLQPCASRKAAGREAFPVRLFIIHIDSITERAPMRVGSSCRTLRPFGVV